MNQRSDIGSLLAQSQWLDPATVPPRGGPRPRRQRRLTAPEVEALGELYSAGAAIAELARRFEIHRTTVVEHITRLGLPYEPRKPKLAGSDLELAVDRYRRGDVVRDIAASFQVHPQTLRRALMRAAQDTR